MTKREIEIARLLDACEKAGGLAPPYVRYDDSPEPVCAGVPQREGEHRQGLAGARRGRQREDPVGRTGRIQARTEEVVPHSEDGGRGIAASRQPGQVAHKDVQRPLRLEGRTILPVGPLPVWRPVEMRLCLDEVGVDER